VAPTVVTDKGDPLAFLIDVMKGIIEPSPDQLKAAIAAAQYVHIKAGDGGKKDAQKDAAKKVANKFAVTAPPKLVAAGGKKV
jgi:phage terminase small subunit